MIMETESLQNIFTLSVNYSIVGAIAAVAVIALAYKLVSRYISHLCHRLGVEAHIENMLRLVLRIATIGVGLGTLSVVYGLPITWLLGGSAFVGAIIGFGSSQTINNLIAGLYIVIAKPFAVKDYVKIGEVEGQVEEISINYTKLYTPSYNLLSMPNIQVMNSQVLNYTHEGLIKYSFLIGFSHDIPNEELINECIQPAIEEFYNKNSDKIPRKPEYYFESSSSGGRAFRIRIFIPKGQARTLYDLQPELLHGIVNRWDIYRKSVNKKA
jgi:small-conductance mechanosensitive channel